MLLISESYRR